MEIRRGQVFQRFTVSVVLVACTPVEAISPLRSGLSRNGARAKSGSRRRRSEIQAEGPEHGAIHHRPRGVSRANERLLTLSLVNARNL